MVRNTEPSVIAELLLDGNIIVKNVISRPLLEQNKITTLKYTTRPNLCLKKEIDYVHKARTQSSKLEYSDTTEYETGEKVSHSIIVKSAF